MTHPYLLKDDPMPECIPCYCALTVKHILIECVAFMEVRDQYFDVLYIKSFKECLRMLIHLRSLLSLRKLVYLRSFKSYIY